MTSKVVSRLAREPPETEEKVSGFGGGDDERRGAGQRARFVAHPGRPRSRWERDRNATRTSVPPDWRERGGNGARGDCDGLQDRASWIPLAVDFNQDGATVTETVTSTFAALPNFAWTFESGTISIDGSHTPARSCQRARAPLGWRFFSGLSFISGVCHRLRLGPAPGLLPSRDADPWRPVRTPATVTDEPVSLLRSSR